MRRETGARFAMVGRGALADPWIFSGHRATREEALDFLRDYAAAMRERGQFPAGGVVARLKQLLRHFSVGGLVPDETTRASLLRERSADAPVLHRQ
jgi:tRNA-dihydrouridine synthase